MQLSFFDDLKLGEPPQVVPDSTQNPVKKAESDVLPNSAPALLKAALLANTPAGPPSPPSEPAAGPSISDVTSWDTAPSPAPSAASPKVSPLPGAQIDIALSDEAQAQQPAGLVQVDSQVAMQAAMPKTASQGDQATLPTVANAAAAPKILSNPAPAATETPIFEPECNQPGMTKSERLSANARALEVVNYFTGLHLLELPKSAIDALSAYTGGGGVSDSLNEYYTPKDLTAAMWRLLGRVGYEGNAVLEPSSGIGAFLATAPAGQKFTSIEMSQESAAIQRLLYPTARQYLPLESRVTKREIEAAADERVADLFLDDKSEDAYIQAYRADFIRGAEGYPLDNQNNAYMEGRFWSLAKHKYPSSVSAANQARVKKTRHAMIERRIRVILAEDKTKTRADLGPLVDASVAAREEMLRYAAIAGLQENQIEAMDERFSEPEITDVVIRNAPFEEAAKSIQGVYDLVIGNPPFGIRGGTVGIDGKNIARAEDYFVLRSLAAVKPGGFVAMVVPSGLLSARRGAATRRAISMQAELLGAFRMPSSTFEKAGTAVVTDIVIFRRRDADVAAIIKGLGAEILKKSQVLDETFIAGNYFDTFPSHIFGSLEDGWRKKAGIGDDIAIGGTVADAIRRLEEVGPAQMEVPLTASLLVERVNAAVPTLPDGFWRLLASKTKEALVQGVVEPIFNVADFGPSVFSAAAAGEAISELILCGGDPTPAREAIEKHIDTYGPLGTDPDITEFMRLSRRLPVDTDYQEASQAAELRKFISLATGSIREDGHLSDILRGAGRPKSAFDLQDAITMLSAEASPFSASTVSRILADQTLSADTIRLAIETRDDCEPLDETYWLSSDMFYSGDLWERLDETRRTIAETPDGHYIERHRKQESLLVEKIGLVSLEEVEITLTSGFIKPGDIGAFLRETSKGGYENYEDLDIILEDSVYFTVVNGVIKEGSYGRAGLILKHLNRNGVKKEDAPQIDQCNREFRRWVLTSSRRDDIEERYNRAYRGYDYSERAYSRKAVPLAGLSINRSVNDYHYSNLRWALETRRCILAADVGVGKTTSAILATKYLSEMGLAQRSMIVVPKNIAAKWEREIRGWFPDASILLIGETIKTGKGASFAAKADSAITCRQKFQQMRQNRYDFVLCTESAWSLLDINPKKKWEIARKDFWIQRGDRLGNAGDKKIKKMREAYNQAIASRNYDRRDDTIYFDDLNIDLLILDEYHRYKNLFAPRARYGQVPKFLGGSGESIRAYDTYLKIATMLESTHNAFVMGMTATPFKNSPVEIFSALHPLCPEEFERMGIMNVEQFIDRYCEFTDEAVLNLEGDIEQALVTSGFKNLHELLPLMRKYILRIKAEDVGLVLPHVDPVENLVEMTPQQKVVYHDIRQKIGSDDSMHIFSALSQMAKASIDLEMLDKSHVGEASPKIDKLVENIMTAYYANRGGHLVFCDHNSVHEKIRDALVAAGMPHNQIAIMNATTAPTSDSRLAIGDALNTGQIKVVIGNTAVMGEGSDLQITTTYIHDLDLPWDPDTLHQRHGRAVRQGNLNDQVEINTYLAVGSNDAYRYQTITAKKNWQDELWAGVSTTENPARVKAPGRVEMMILLSDDPVAARAAYEADMSAALARNLKTARMMFNQQYRLFLGMVASEADMASAKNSPARLRIQKRIADLEASLLSTPWLTEKSFITERVDAFFQEENGGLIKRGAVVQITDKDHGPEPLDCVVTSVRFDPDGSGYLVDTRRFGTLLSGPGFISQKNMDGVSYKLIDPLKDGQTDLECLIAGLRSETKPNGRKISGVDLILDLGDDFYFTHKTDIDKALIAKENSYMRTPFDNNYGLKWPTVDKSGKVNILSGTGYGRWSEEALPLIAIKAQREDVIRAAIEVWEQAKLNRNTTQKGEPGHLSWITPDYQALGVREYPRMVVEEIYGSSGVREYEAGIEKMLFDALSKANDAMTIIKLAAKIFHRNIKHSLKLNWHEQSLGLVMEKAGALNLLDQAIIVPRSGRTSGEDYDDGLYTCLLTHTNKPIQLRPGMTVLDWIEKASLNPEVVRMVTKKRAEIASTKPATVGSGVTPG